MKNSRKYRPEFLFLTLSIGIALLFVCVEISSPGTRTSAAVPLPSLSNATETVEETVTLSPSDLKTWTHGYNWHEAHWYCGPSFHMEPAPEEIAGSMVVGYHHFWDPGAKVFGCPEAATLVTRGTVWFDLSSIASKAPPLHVSVTRALLRYKMDKGCDDHQLLIAQEDWLKGYPDNKLVPGESFAGIHSSCASEGKSPSDAVCAPEDVAKVLNNWLRGEGNGGYANYGFAFAGTVEEDFLSEKLGHWLDNDACWTRFSDFSLTVTYKYDKAPDTVYVLAPNRPGPGNRFPGELAPVDLALKKTATQSSTLTGGDASHAVDGNTDGLFASGSVAHTDIESQPWWQVDLGSVKSIGSIKVWNRVEGPERTSDFYVFVSDVPFTSTNLEATKTQVGPGGYFFTSGPCGRPTEIAVNKTGRYVRVQLSRTNYLQLAEVEVFAGKK